MFDPRPPVVRPAPPTKHAAHRALDAGLRAPLQARPTFVVGAAIAEALGAVAVLLVPGVDAALISLVLLLSAALTLLSGKLLPAASMPAALFVINVVTPATITIIEPPFWPAAAMWVGAQLTWQMVMSPRRISLPLALFAVATASVTGAIVDAPSWELVAVGLALIAGFYTFIGEMLRREVWESESALVDVLSAAGAMVHHASLDDGTILSLEGDVVGLTGWTRDEWCAASHRDFIHPDDVDAYWIDAETVEPNTIIDRLARVRHADGSWVWLRDIVRVIFDDDGRRYLRGFTLDVTELEEATRTVARQARYDQLTGLANRYLLNQRLDALLDEGVPFALAVLDLDRFKEVNDSLGHEAGDQLLQVIGDRMAAEIGEDDLLARIGGDEFAIIVHGAASEAEVQPLLRRVAMASAQPLTVAGVRIAVSVSAGVAVHTSPADDRATLLRHADIAMYEAKRESKMYRMFDDSLERTSTRRLSLSAALPEAIDTGELTLYFQPKIELATGRLVGAEGLARWEHPDFGVLAPAAFLDLALMSESTVDFALTTIQQAVSAIRHLRELGHEVPIAVNVALGALHGIDFFDSVMGILEWNRIPPHLLIIELTENDVQWPSTEMVQVLDRLHEAGVRLSVDDFGTGHSSMERLRILPISELKIDRSFVSRMIDHPLERHIVNTIVEFAHGFDGHLVAEGVETEEQAELLRTMGCPIAQGFLFGRPMPRREFVREVQRQATRLDLAVTPST